MYSESYLRPTSSSSAYLPSSYSPYFRNQSRDYSSYSLKTMGDSNRFQMIRNTVESHLPSSRYRIRPSSLREQYQDNRASYLMTSPNRESYSNRCETASDLSKHQMESQPKPSDDVMKYMDYLLTQLEKSIQLNQDLTSAYDSIEKRSKKISEENAQLKEIYNELQSNQPRSDQNEGKEEKEKEIDKLLESKDKIISNLAKQCTILSKQKENMVATLMNYEKEIIEMGKSVEALSIDQPNQQSQSPEKDEQEADQDEVNEEEAEAESDPQLAEARELISKLKEDNIKLSKENKDKANKITQLKVDINKQIKHVSNINDEAKQYANKFSSLSTMNNEKDQIMNDLKNKTDMLKSQNKIKSKDESQPVYYNKEFKEKYDQEEEKNTQLKKSLNELKDINTSLIDSKDKMKDAYSEIIKKLQQTVDESISKYKNIEEIMIENRDLKKKNEMIEEQLKSMPDIAEALNALNHLKSESDQLRKVINAKNMQFDNNNANANANDNDEQNKDDANNDEKEEEEVDEEEEAVNEEEKAQKEKESTIQIKESQPSPPDTSFLLYTICLNKLIAYDFNIKAFIAVTPQKYDEFLKEYQQENSIYYNIYKGLMVITGKEYNKLFYYSPKQNTISFVIKLMENHSNGAMLLDDTTQSLIVLSGDNTSKVEQFGFKTKKHSYLPPMLKARSNASYCFINHKLYGFFGFNKETQKALSTIECLNLDSCSSWEYVNYTPKSNRDYAMSHHLVANINDNDLLILGGIKTNTDGVNEKVIIMNMNDMTIEESKSDLPNIQKNKFYMFDNNAQSNEVLLNDSTFIVGIDCMNNVHMIDSDFNYKMIFFKK